MSFKSAEGLPIEVSSIDVAGNAVVDGSLAVVGSIACGSLTVASVPYVAPFVPTIATFDIPDTVSNFSGAVLPFITSTVVGGKYQIILNARVLGNGAGTLSSVTGTISNGAYNSINNITLTTPSISEYYVCLTACFISTTANVNITLSAVTGGGATWDVGTPSQYTIVRLA